MQTGKPNRVCKKNTPARSQTVSQDGLEQCRVVILVADLLTRESHQIKTEYKHS